MNHQMNQSWLPLTEYSSKYRVSMSTLRRRIKTEDIQFRFSDGKYFIVDAPLVTSQRPSLGQLGARDEKRPSQSELFSSVARETRRLEFVEDKKSSASVAPPPKKSEPRDEPILTAANRLLTELKRAYSQILSEKEEQILNLRAEVSDLKTLIKVLESDNDRLKNKR